MDPVLAYFDPGAGSLLIQMLLGGAGGLLVAMRYLWSEVASRRLRRNRALASSGH